MKNSIKLIAQDFNIYNDDNLHSEARTSAISINHLVSAGANGVILGHSEVGDSPTIMNSKLKTIINNKEVKKISDNFIFNILVGESWEEFKNKTNEQIADSIFKKCKIIFKDIPVTALNNLIIGYEPKWGSRGSGRDDMPPPNHGLISTCIKSIKQFMENNYNDIAPFYIYGGRSTPERTLKILSDDNIDGLILGSACNTLQKTIDIIEVMKKIKGTKNKIIICNFKAYILPNSYKKYVQKLKTLSDNFFVYLAPSYTDIRLLKQLI